MLQEMCCTKEGLRVQRAAHFDVQGGGGFVCFFVGDQDAADAVLQLQMLINPLITP